jgi:hypothetical protein
MKHFLLTILLFISCLLLGGEPWVGGLNACQFGRMDLDRDGKKDLVVFDRHGNRLLCFLNKGDFGAIDYQYTTDYNEAFPRLTDWAVFADYDGDGREDIFTFSKGWAGIKVYHNISNSETLGFELVVTPYLTSFQGGGAVNLFATDSDYPAIVDLDDDGDLDILTFGVMGNFIEKHLNLSMERYGCRDSLVFERSDMCWGRVAESEEDNLMYLDTCLFGYGLKVTKDGVRHRGATVTVRDLNGDGLPDLLLADVDYPGLTLLVNGGDNDQAVMVSQTDAFPPSAPVNLRSMPVPFFTDINNDGIDDLLVSPFDPNPMASDGIESVWLYINHGTNEILDFQLYTKSFLQGSMIDVGKGAYPVFTDWDGDGLTDLKVRDFEGKTTVFKNVGTAQQPAFEQMTSGTEGAQGWSAQCYFDVDGDGLLDMVEGQVAGRLTFYKGHANGYEWITDFWGEVDVCDYQTSYYGYSVPTLFEYQGQMLLCVGSEQGRLFLYRVSEEAAFEEVDYLWEELCPDMPERFGIHSAAAISDLNGDGILEVIVGNYGGGLQLYNASIPVVNLGILEEVEDVEVLIFPNPVISLLHVVTPSSLRGASATKQSNLNYPELGQVGLPPLTVGELRLLRFARNDVRVMDIFGRILIEKESSSSETIIDVSNLAPGVYLVQLVLERGLVNRIFLKR